MITKRNKLSLAMNHKSLDSVQEIKSFLKEKGIEVAIEKNVEPSKFDSEKKPGKKSQDKVEDNNSLFCDEEYKKVWNKALNILNYRGHSVNELKGKLFDRELPAKHIYNVIEELERLGFLDDKLFAEIYVEDLLRRGYGAMRIKNYLYKKRLSADLISKSIVKIDFDEQVQTAIKLIENKLRGGFRREADPFKLQQKLMRHLVGRGFTFDVINGAFAETIKKKQL